MHYYDIYRQEEKKREKKSLLAHTKERPRASKSGSPSPREAAGAPSMKRTAARARAAWHSAGSTGPAAGILLKTTRQTDRQTDRQRFS